MFYVYLLSSQLKTDERYIGSTDNLKKRLAEHNAGKSIHTNKFRPWKLVTYVAFATRGQAEKFEKYLKHSSGHAFAKRHLC